MFETHLFHHLNAIAAEIKLQSIDTELRVALDDSDRVPKLGKPEGECITSDASANDEYFEG